MKKSLICHKTQTTNQPTSNCDNILQIISFQPPHTYFFIAHHIFDIFFKIKKKRCVIKKCVRRLERNDLKYFVTIGCWLVSGLCFMAYQPL